MVAAVHSPVRVERRIVAAHRVAVVAHKVVVRRAVVEVAHRVVAVVARSRVAAAAHKVVAVVAGSDRCTLGKYLPVPGIIFYCKCPCYHKRNMDQLQELIIPFPGPVNYC